MADRPITFSGPMVRALLAGTKTQTRRLLQRYVCSPDMGMRVPPDLLIFAPGEVYRPPIIKTGDRLYVREHWRADTAYDGTAPRDLSNRVALWFESDGGTVGDGVKGRFRQAMHMPKWASRITLHVTEVRVQRLNEIGHGDCMAEGVRHVPNQSLYDLDLGDGTVLQAMNPFGVYHQLMDRLHGDGFWASNPWVTATSFEVELCHIDQARAA